MQNIPSHAVDIRHEFRATPATFDKVKCEYTNNVVSTTTSRFNSVYLKDGSRRYIDALEQNDEVRFNQEGIETYLSVISVEVDELKTTCEVRFNSEHEGEYELPIITSPYVIMSSDYSLQKSWL